MIKHLLKPFMNIRTERTDASDNSASLDTPELKGSSSFLWVILRFSPLLFLYVFIIVMFSSNNFWGDEGRYVMFAENLIDGYYSPLDKVYLWNGPGYPIFLMPFVFFKIPLLTAKLFNGLFLFMAIIYFYYTLRLYMRKNTAMFFSYMLGLYPPFMRYIHLLLTEQLSIFLICGFMFHFCKLQRDDKNSWVQLAIACIYLGYLALTKSFFGYVILSGLFISLIFYIWNRQDSIKKAALVFLFTLLLCIPYLFYTYSLTGKLFYWGNTGGFMLYLMSSPYEEELGDWSERNAEHHLEFYKELEELPAIEKDDMLKKQAIQNIASYPAKYLKNWLANIGRLLFNYPFSYTPQKLTSYFYIIPNMFLTVCWTICLYPSYVGRRLIPFEIKVLFLFGLISFAGMSLVNAENRYFWPLIPIYLLWIAFAFVRLLKIEIQR